LCLIEKNLNYRITPILIADYYSEI